MSTTAAPGRRLPESTASAMYVARVLHERVRARGMRSSGAPARAAVAAEPALDRLELPVKQSLVGAASATKDRSLRLKIIEVARGPGFAALSIRVQRELLNALARPGATEALALELARLAEMKSFGELDRALQSTIVAEHARLGREGLALIASSAFPRLDRGLQLELIRWTAGPRHAPWDARRRELAALLAVHDLASMPVEEQAERLFDFLHAPSRAVYFVEAKYYGGPASIVFGDPGEPGSLAYVRKDRIYRREGPAMLERDGDVRGYVRATLSREEERVLVEWIERTYGQPRPIAADPMQLRDAAFRLAKMLAARRGGLELSAGSWRFGEIYEPPPPSDVEVYCDGLLAELFDG
jgi:hypothetical protein